MSNLVPNKFPTYPSNLRIALIGEAPGADEDRLGQPFMGASGRFLAALLSRAGINKEACYLGNVSQYKPVGHDFSFAWSGDEVQEGLYQLGLDMKEFKPNVVVLLGNIPLKAAKDVHTELAKKALYSNAKWRGSLFLGMDGSPFASLKCLSTYHPAYCLRDYDSVPMLQFDLRKAVREGASPLLNLPNRTFITSYDILQIINNLREIRKHKQPVAIDIEGGIDTMSCISFAIATDKAFIVPIYNKSGEVLITPEVWRELALTLEDPYVPKILQNSLYDRFVLHYSYGIRVRGVAHDTMLKHWELYSELEKSLGVQASIYTDEPYYKGERKSQDDKTFYEYCCRDSAVTLEISNKIEPMLGGTSKPHYELNMGLLNPFLYMELRGIRYAINNAALRRAELQRQLYICHAKLNALTGFGFQWNEGIKQVFETARGNFGRKKEVKKGLVNTFDDLAVHCLKGTDSKPYNEWAKRLAVLVKQTNPNLSTMGEIERLCEVGLNVNSDDQFQGYVYGTLKLPTQMSKVRGEVPHPTTDYEALLNLSKWCVQNKHDQGFAVCQAAIEIRALQTRQGMLAISADRDGRIRCGYNVVGSNTGRTACYESPTGSGYNLQTIPNYHDDSDNPPGGIMGDRDLFLADEGYYIFQCDLSGADGWTYAAYCAMMGDNRMIEEYRLGIKPYARIALKIVGDKMADHRDSRELAEFLKTIKLKSVPKLTAKRVQHGGAYLEGGLTISRNVLKDSEGKVSISPIECDKLKNWYINEMYWGIPKWHDWTGRQLRNKPVLTAASGQVRQFFGRPDDVLTKAVAFEPQANTTYATNLAAWRLWNDKENRISITLDGTQSQRGCSLRIEPLHQVHDALVGQFRKEDTAWAISKVKNYFSNPLQIAGQTITIPYEGTYGSYWGSNDGGTL